MSSYDFEAHIAQEYAQWCQKKRPASPELRAELLLGAKATRSRLFARRDGQPMTPEDWRQLKQGQRARYRLAKAIALEVEAKMEADFWQFLSKYGLYPEGGLQ
jgi:hypothetical protein